MKLPLGGASDLRITPGSVPGGALPLRLADAVWSRLPFSVLDSWSCGSEGGEAGLDEVENRSTVHVQREVRSGLYT